MDKKLKARKVGTFLTLAFAISWMIGVLLYVLDIGISTQAGSILLLIFMWGPAISGIINLYIWTDEGFISELKRYFGFTESGLNKKWTLLAWLSPLVVLSVMLGLGGLYPDVNFTVSFGEASISILMYLIIGLTINALAAFGEEFGWRAILLDELSSFGYWKVSVIIGLIWGIWHAPLILWGYYFPGNTAMGVLVMMVFTITFSHIFTYFTLRSQTILAPAFLHGSYNSIIPLAFGFLTGINELLFGPTGVIGIIGVLILLLICIIHDSFIAEESVMNKKSMNIWS